MKKVVYLQIIIIVTFILFFLVLQSINAEDKCDINDCKLRLRLELGSSFRVGHDGDKSDGLMFSSIFDLGKEFFSRTNLSLRILPVFGYIQEGNVEDLIGFGLGGAIRIFFKKNQEKGFFTEAHEIICIHENKFEGNDSNINFYSSVGIGYQFSHNWDILLRFGHISNANIKSANEGMNLLGIGIGYVF